MKDIALIGAGRRGTALGRALVRAGFKVRFVADVSRPAALRLARALPGALPARDNGQAARSARVIFLCVPDSVIREAAADLAGTGKGWPGRIVVHCSGALDARELDPLRKCGAWTASAHPVQSFTLRSAANDPFRGIPVGIEGQTGAAAWLKRAFVRMGAKPMLLRPGVKPLYHAACSLASNGLVFLLDAAQELLVEAGFSRRAAAELLGPLVQRTLHNVNKLGTARALTGPLARGDEATIARHLSALGKYPRTRALYRQLGLKGLDLVRRTGTGPQKVRALRRLLEDK